ncbi:MAG: COX15/CtaA family protein [Cyclobacteriaceae bacterium]|nr:COX15/CtaA family protein [Cyclobacteriaceae bacterium]
MGANRRFYRLTLSTLVAVYLLILVGGIVRSTGSGMGCPDWPKCFGQWVPPTSVEELPENYKEIYSDYRHQKNIKFAKYLRAVGFNQTANQILSDESIREEADFNAVKTWIEYINRLMGAVIGLLIFAVFAYSLRFRSTNRRWPILAFIIFVLVVFQGWIGSIVVSTNLTPWTITVHMFLALVIVCLLIYLVYQIGRTTERRFYQQGIFPWLLASMATVLVQILLGTQVREVLDQVSIQLANRAEWIEAIGITFVIHRTFSWIVVVVHVGLFMKLRKSDMDKHFVLTLFLLILGTLISGIGMAYFAVPPFLQPLHLLLATVTFGYQFLLALRVNTSLKPVLS